MLSLGLESYFQGPFTENRKTTKISGDMRAKWKLKMVWPSRSASEEQGPELLVDDGGASALGQRSTELLCENVTSCQKQVSSKGPFTERNVCTSLWSVVPVPGLLSPEEKSLPQ